VNHFSPDGKLLAQWGIHGTNAGLLTFPRSVAVNSRQEIYVSEYGLVERVQRFTARGEKFINSFGQAGTGPGEFNRAEGLFIDSQDRVYVADSCNHRIQIFTREGQFLRAYGKPGRGLGELSYPYDICVDKHGRQYVCEFGNSRIQVFDSNDHPIEIIGGPGTDPGQFGNPWGVALDSAGDLYVADSQNHRVQKLIPRNKISQQTGRESMPPFQGYAGYRAFLPGALPRAVLWPAFQAGSRSQADEDSGFWTFDLALWTLGFFE
jgi:DNA-binding beta-propeller fold protein YncE